jgi:hypothetical protein
MIGVVALVAGIVCLCASQAAFAQTPQNPEACAQLRADLGNYIRYLMAIGQTEERDAMYAAETTLTIRRITGDPCFGTLTPANRDACVRLQSDMMSYIREKGGRGNTPLRETMDAARRVLEMRRITGDPCFMPAPRQVPADDGRPLLNIGNLRLGAEIF